MDSIGNKIKTLRIKNGLTQGKLAENLGISYQAVSKWETGATTPDLSYIIPLAKIFHVSTDELLGNIDRLAEFNEKWQKALRLGEFETLKITHEALKEFPNDETFLYRRACDEYFCAQKTDDPEQKQRYYELSVFHYKSLVKEYPDFDSAKSMLVQVLSELGRFDEALVLAYELPDKDRMLYLCLQDDKLEENCQKQIDKSVQDLLDKLMRYNKDESFQFAKKIIQSLISDGNYLYYYDNLISISYKRAVFLASQNRHEEAIEELENYLVYAKELMLLFGKDKPVYFTAPLFDKLVYDIPNVPHETDIVKMNFKHCISSPKFDCLRNRDDFLALIERIDE